MLVALDVVGFLISIVYSLRYILNHSQNQSKYILLPIRRERGRLFIQQLCELLSNT